MGVMTDRTHRDLTADDVARIAGTYHAWRHDVGAGLAPAPSARSAQGDDQEGDDQDDQEGDHKGRPYADTPGFCKSATLDDIRGHGYVLTPGRYVGAAAAEDDGEPFADKMARLTAELRAQMAEGRRLDEAIWMSLEGLVYEEPMD